MRNMGRKAIELGATGRTVARNITRFRALRGLTLAQLSARMDGVGRAMTGNTLSAIENQSRRADVDDLVAIAAALDISPAALLMPDVDDLSDTPPTTTHPEGSGEWMARQFWDWLVADAPLNAPASTDDRDDFAVEQWRRDQVPEFAYRMRGHRD